MQSVLSNPGKMLKAKESGPSVVVHKGIGDFKIFKDMPEYAIHHLEEFQKGGKITYKRFQLLRKSIKLGAGKRAPELQKKLESHAKMAYSHLARQGRVSWGAANQLLEISELLKSNKEHVLAEQFDMLAKKI